MIALGWVVNLMQRGSASLERINQILREQPDHRRAARRRCAWPPCAARSSSAASSMDYRQRPRARRHRPAHSGRRHAWRWWAIPGRGKSTLVSLVPRLFDPTAGAVLLDGIDLRELDPAELRRQIGFVPQETFLFSATIAGEHRLRRGRRHRRSRSAAPRKSRAWPAISRLSRRATRPWWASAASRFPAARSSAPPSPAPSCATRAS